MNMVQVFTMDASSAEISGEQVALKYGAHGVTIKHREDSMDDVHTVFFPYTAIQMIRTWTETEDA